MAAWAAQPQWILFTVPPVRFAFDDARRHAGGDTHGVDDAVSRKAAEAAMAAAEAIAPQIDVACWPRSKKTELRPARS